MECDNRIYASKDERRYGWECQRHGVDEDTETAKGGRVQLLRDSYTSEAALCMQWDQLQRTAANCIGSRGQWRRHSTWEEREALLHMAISEIAMPDRDKKPIYLSARS